jgi:hypothetical protein
MTQNRRGDSCGARTCFVGPQKARNSREEKLDNGHVGWVAWNERPKFLV